MYHRSALRAVQNLVLSEKDPEIRGSGGTRQLKESYPGTGPLDPLLYVQLQAGAGRKDERSPAPLPALPAPAIDARMCLLDLRRICHSSGKQASRQQAAGFKVITGDVQVD